MELRRDYRVTVQNKVRFLTAGTDNPIVARAQNLSPRGVYVTTPAADLPPVGSLVFCGFSLANESRTLRGRVVWVRTPSKAEPLASTGAGIEFVDVEGRDAELLRRMIDPAEQPKRPAQVFCEGVSEPLRCEAVVAGQDVRLSVPLPLLRPRSVVRVGFDPNLGPAGQREGTIESLVLEPGEDGGVPQLRVNLVMSRLDHARGTIESKPNGASPTTPLPAVGSDKPAPSLVVDATLQATPPEWLLFGRNGHAPPPARNGTPPASMPNLEPPPPPDSPRVTAPLPALRRPTGSFALPVVGAPTPGLPQAPTLMTTFRVPPRSPWYLRGATPVLFGSILGALLASFVWRAFNAPDRPAPPPSAQWRSP